LPKWKKENYVNISPPGCLKTSFPEGSALAIDLLSKMLDLDPNKRILAKEALSHPYFT